MCNGHSSPSREINKATLFPVLHFTAFFVTWVCHMLIPNLYLVGEMSLIFFP